MKKLILPILFGVFTLSFSGKSISHKNCGPNFIFYNFPGMDPSHITLPVTQIIIENLTWGTRTVHDNPTFPYYSGIVQGGWLKVSFVFDGSPYKACVYLEDSNAECIQTQGTIVPDNSAAITFSAFNCDQYYISINHLLSNETCDCAGHP
ncbi:MAG TPA: hypothetical protein VF008_05610 [Niastella sp.]